LRRDLRRSLGTFGSLVANNLFLFIALLMYGAFESGMEPQSAEPFLVLLTVLLLFPLSADPLDRIPRSRLALWPLGTRERALLRLAALALSPVLWIAVAALVVKTRRPALGLLFLSAEVVVSVVASLGRRVVRSSQASVLRWVPPLPGRLGGLIRNNLRQMLSTLDAYAAILFSLGGSAYLYLYAHPDPAAAPIFAILVGLTLSTYAQCLFGLDWAGSAITRYRLLPLSPWEIVLAKDIAYLTILTILVLPINVFVGLTFGLAALAMGHYVSLSFRAPQRRWRFTGGRVLLGTVQGTTALALAFSSRENPALFLALSAGMYGVSLGLCAKFAKWSR
jgi:hypothetical protein